MLQKICRISLEQNRQTDQVSKIWKHSWIERNSEKKYPHCHEYDALYS